jgi:hypothetical protein
MIPTENTSAKRLMQRKVFYIYRLMLTISNFNSYEFSQKKFLKCESIKYY